MNKKNKIIIGSLCGVLLLMVVGYAAFSSLLNINGTSTISSNWEVKITNIVSKNIIGTASNASDPTYDDLSATFKTNLVSPGDSIEYDVTVSNEGNINAKLDKITLTDSNNSAIKFSTSGLKEGDSLNAGDSAVLTVKVEYDDSVTSQPSNLSSTLTVKLDYSQNKGNSGGSIYGGNGAATLLTQSVVTSGDGIYQDEYETGKYIYKGADPNNYITFNNEIWRIISVETDGTIKIIKNESIGEMAFDSAGLRTSGYCSNTDTTNGCNAWTKTDNLNTTFYSGKVDKDAELNTYLNNTYYNSLTTKAQNNIQTKTFNTGGIKDDNITTNPTPTSEIIKEEQTNNWKGKIALITLSEYIKATTNTNCLNAYAYRNNTNCYNNSNTHNWMFKNTYMMMLSPNDIETSNTLIMYVYDYGRVGSGYTSLKHSVFPTLYLKSEIELTGNGAKTDPYIII